MELVVVSISVSHDIPDEPVLLALRMNSQEVVRILICMLPSN